MRQIDVTIKGTAGGLLMQRFRDETMADSRSAFKRVGTPHGTPEQQAAFSAYFLEDGTLCQPAEHIFQSLCKAAGDYQVKGRGKKTYKDSVKGGVLIEPEYIAHKSNEYIIDSRPVRIQRARIGRHRPLVQDWELSFRLTVIDETIPLDVLNAILTRAGQSVGIGDYRPRYGRFIVQKFEVV